MEETLPKEEKQESPTLDDEIKKALEVIPDIEENPEQFEEVEETPLFEEGANTVDEIEEGQESKYGI